MLSSHPLLKSRCHDLRTYVALLFGCVGYAKLSMQLSYDIATLVAESYLLYISTQTAARLTSLCSNELTWLNSSNIL
jgi:hypothetical protein